MKEYENMFIYNLPGLCINSIQLQRNDFNKLMTFRDVIITYRTGQVIIEAVAVLRFLSRSLVGCVEFSRSAP